MRAKCVSTPAKLPPKTKTQRLSNELVRFVYSPSGPKCLFEKAVGGGPARDFYGWEGGTAAMMLGHHGKDPTLPGAKSTAGPTRQTSRTDTKAYCWVC